MASGCRTRVMATGALSIALGVGIAWGAAFQVKLPIEGAIDPGPGEWIGAIHVHTRTSDGSGTIDDVAEAANHAGLDFVIVTDHNKRAAETSYYEGDVLVAVGQETSTYDGHVLVLGAEPGWREGRTKETAKALELAGKAGGTRIVAHPVGTKEPWELETDAVEGMEIWNADAEWRNDDAADWAKALSISVVNPPYGFLQMVDRPDEGLEIFANRITQRPFGGICSVDAHARVAIAGDVALEYPTYERMFELLRQHVLMSVEPPRSGSAPALQAAEAELYRALAAGRSYCALDALADASGLFVRVTNHTSEAVGLGESVDWTGRAHLSVILPPAGEEAQLIVYRGAERLTMVEGRTLDLDLTEPGAYWIEARLRVPSVVGHKGRYIPWILTNPVYVVDS